MSNAAEMEAVLFKPIAGGYLFQAANPWVFGRMTRYVVTDAQKAELLAIIRPRRPVLWITGITAGILLWAGAIATAMWAVSGHDQPTVADFAIMTALILVPIYLAWVIQLQRNQRRMQPILATAPRTDERIGAREMRQAMAGAMSLRRTLLLVALWSFSCATQVFTLLLRNARHPLFSDVQSYLSLVTAALAAGLAAYYLYLAVRKIRQPRPASA